MVSPKVKVTEAEITGVAVISILGGVLWLLFGFYFLYLDPVTLYSMEGLAPLINRVGREGLILITFGMAVLFLGLGYWNYTNPKKTTFRFMGVFPLEVKPKK